MTIATTSDLLTRLIATKGNVTINEGTLWFEDGTHCELSSLGEREAWLEAELQRVRQNAERLGDAAQALLQEADAHLDGNEDKDMAEDADRLREVLAEINGD